MEDRRSPDPSGILTNPLPGGPSAPREGSDGGSGARPRENVFPAGWPSARWDRYRDVSLLGSGGMGRVYRAFDVALDRWVAIKVLTGDDPRLAERLGREARAQARIEHPNVCKVYDVGELEGTPFIAMQLVEGEPLGDLAPSLSLEQKVLLVRQVAEGVHAAHRAGLIHRDLKPANVMVATRGEEPLRPYVVDFGVVRDAHAASLTATGLAVGTPAFMAPEQARGDTARVDRRTDVWALGAILYELLAGAPPFEGDSALDVMLKVVQEEPVPLRKRVPSLPEDLETIVARCLEKDPGRRYDSARALAEDLGRFLDGEPIAARRVSLAHRLLVRARKNRAVTVVAGVSSVLLLALLALWVREVRASARGRELARHFGQEVERVEGLLWRARSLPLHDVRPAREAVRRRLAGIAAEMARAGKVAVGPGSAALGRGHLALYEWDDARRHLSAAWDAGLREPDVAWGLGLALGQVYRRELAALTRLRNPRERERRKGEIERELRDVALQRLRASAGADTPAEYVEALVAFFEGRLPEASKKAREAVAKVPWLHEAFTLEGDVLRARVEAEQATATPAQIRATFEKADAAYREALVVARSDERALSRRCSLWSDVLWREVWNQHAGRRETLGRAESACWEALEGDSGGFSPHASLAAAYMAWAEQTSQSGGDPAPVVENAIASARAAVKLEPRDASLERMLGIVHWSRGKIELDRGRDPTGSFELAIEHARRALSLAPPDPRAHGDLGLSFLNLGLAELDRGRDPTALLAEAVARTSEAIELVPGTVSYPNNLGIAHQGLLRWEVRERGGDGLAHAERAVDAFRLALAADPGSIGPRQWLATVYTELGEGERLSGRDPSWAVAEARRIHDEAMTRNPKDAYGRALMADAHLVEARWSGRAEPLAAARREVGASLEFAPGNASALLTLAEVELVSAAAARAAGRSPLPALDEAGASLSRLLRESALFGIVWCRSAQVALEKGRLPGRGRADALRDARAGLSAAARALDASPCWPRALALSGELHLLEAGLLPEGPARELANALGNAALEESVFRSGGRPPGTWTEP